VKAVSKLAQKKISEASTWGSDTTEEELALRGAALKTIVFVIKSMHEWSKPLHVPAIDPSSIKESPPGME